jgi:peptidoglycan/LPS O-acetylase OafA/YrhL
MERICYENCMNEPKREYYIDWLKIIVVALLVPHHIAITFSHIGDAYVFMPVKDNSLYFFIQSSFLNLWFMRLLFFVSGISTFHALKKRTNKQYFTERCKRLLLPTVVAIIFICPMMAYFRALNLNGFQGSLLKFFPVFFTKFETYLGWAHFWFLIYLFVYSIIFLLLRMLLRTGNKIFENIGIILSKSKYIFLPMGIIMFFELLFRPNYPGKQTLVNDWANFTVYLTFFMVGFIFANNNKCLEKTRENLSAFSVLGVIAAAGFIFLKFASENIEQFIQYYNQFGYKYKLITAFFQGISEYSLVMAIIGFSQKYININNKLYKYLSKTSFALYMFHYLIINIVMYYFIKINLNHYAMFFFAIIIVYIIFFILFELIIKRVNVLKYICGIK